jgi:hypothetical protein
VAVDVPTAATTEDVVGTNVCRGANGVKAVVVVVVLVVMARFRRIVVVVVFETGTVVVVVLVVEVVVVEVVVVVSDEPPRPWFVEAAGTVVFVVNEATSFPTVS